MFIARFAALSSSALFLCISACGGGGESGESTRLVPVIEILTLAPASPKRADAITANVLVNHASEIKYVWRRNGKVVSGADYLNYPLGQQAKGDVISLTVTGKNGKLTTTGSVQVTIADTLPVLTGTLPAKINYGEPVSAQIGASDVDGDAIGTYEVAYGPAGFSVSPSGNVSWVPSGPLFDRSTDMSWGVRLHDWPQAILSGRIMVTDAARQYPLARSNMAAPTQSAGIDIADFDGTGRDSAMVVTPTGLYEFAKQGSGYAQTWMYPFSPAGDATSGESYINTPAVISGDANGDGHREIFFSQGPYVVALDGVSRREIARAGDGTKTASMDGAGPFCNQLRFGDIDHDGASEVVCLASPNGYGKVFVFIFDARTLSLKWQSGQLPVLPLIKKTLALANVDQDAALEIIVSDGTVIDGASHRIEWQYAPGFGDDVDTGDVTGDGRSKIVALDRNGSTVRVFDGVTQTVLWSFHTPNNLSSAAMKVARLEPTAPESIMVGDQQFGNVYVYRYDPATQAPQLRGQVNASGYGARAFAAGDFDGDGHLDLMWSTGAVINAGAHLVVASWAPTFAITWDLPHGPTLDNPFSGAHLATTAPGTKRLLFGTPTTNGIYAGARIIALDTSTGSLSLSSELTTRNSDTFALDAADVTGSGVDTSLFSSDTNGIHFSGYDLASDTFPYTLPITERFVALVHADLNHDGFPDIVGITTSGAIDVLDVHHQVQLWSSGAPGFGQDVEVADLDGDGEPEIIALRADAMTVYKGSGSNFSVQGTLPGVGSDLLVADVDGDGVPEIFVVGSADGGNVQWLSKTLQRMGTYLLPSIRSLYLEESGYGRKNLLASIYDSRIGGFSAQLVAFDPKNGTIIWTSPHLYGLTPINSLRFVDANGDGRREIAFGTQNAMYLTR